MRNVHALLLGGLALLLLAAATAVQADSHTIETPVFENVGLRAPQQDQWRSNIDVDLIDGIFGETSFHVRADTIARLMPGESAVARVAAVTAEFYIVHCVVGEPDHVLASFQVGLRKSLIERTDNREVARWTADVPLSHPPLRTGEWSMLLRAYDTAGRIGSAPPGPDAEDDEEASLCEAAGDYTVNVEAAGDQVVDDPVLGEDDWERWWQREGPHMHVRGLERLAPEQYPRFYLGPGDFIQLNVTDGIRQHYEYVGDDEVPEFTVPPAWRVNNLLIHRITYQVDYGPGGVTQESALSYPYRLAPQPAGPLTHGVQDITFRLYSKAVDGNDPQRYGLPAVVFTLQDVVVDLEPPVVGAPKVPDEVFAAIPFTMQITVDDLLNHSIVARVDGKEFTGRSGDAPNPYTYVFQGVNLNLPGTHNVAVHVTDHVGNRVEKVFPVTALPAFTRIQVEPLEILNATSLPGEGVHVRAPVNQTGGLGQMPVTVRFAYDGQVDDVENVLLELNETTDVEHRLDARPGIHVLEVTVVVPDGVEVREPSSLEASTEFEVFLGLVLHGDTEYWMRADDRSLPASAVLSPGTGSERTFSLQPDLRGPRTVYTFTGEDGDALYWDPFRRDRDDNRPVTFFAPDTDPDPEDSPAPALALVAAGLLGAAAWVARRRR